MNITYGNIIASAFLVLLINISPSAQTESNISNLNNYGELIVTPWAGDAVSAFSFSFDDGFISQYDNVKTILNDYNFSATFYVLPPFLTDSLPGIWRYGTWPMFMEMNDDGFEIASHTLNHLHIINLPAGDTLTENTIHYELYHSKRMINERLQNEDCITLAYPFAEHNPLIDSLTSLYYQSARAVDDIPNQQSPVGMEWFSLKAFQIGFDKPRNTPQDDLDELINFQNWISASIDSGSWAIHLAHEVVPFSELQDLLAQGSYHPISNEWLTDLCNWLDEKKAVNDIWIESVRNVTKYIKERSSYSYQVITQTNNLIEIELTDTLTNNIYNYPLTAYIAVPEDWEAALVEQGSGSEIVNSFYYDSSKVVMASVIPDGGIIKLTESAPIYVAENERENVESYVLYQNYPNPFNPNTKISWQSPVGSWQTLKVYDILGNEIAILVNEEKTAGEYTVTFDASNLPSGMYIYTLQAGSNFLSKKMILLK